MKGEIAMSGIVDIEREAVPAWYDLRMTRRGIAVDLHPQAFQHLVSLFGTGVFASQEHVVHSHWDQKDYPLPPFQNPTSPTGSWGFGGNVHPLRSRRSGWVAFVTTLPVQEKPLDLAKWYQPSASLNALFMALRYPEFRTDFDRPQLLVVSGVMAFARHTYAGAVEASISPALRQWLARDEERLEIPSAAQAMYQTWRGIDKEKPKYSRFFRERFQAETRSRGLLHLSVPGNACGLDPEISYFGAEEGYTLVPHNTDGVVQQWALLAGLAKICELARADGF